MRLITCFAHPLVVACGAWFAMLDGAPVTIGFRLDGGRLVAILAAGRGYAGWWQDNA